MCLLVLIWTQERLGLPGQSHKAPSRDFVLLTVTKIRQARTKPQGRKQSQNPQDQRKEEEECLAKSSKAWADPSANPCSAMPTTHGSRRCPCASPGVCLLGSKRGGGGGGWMLLQGQVHHLLLSVIIKYKPPKTLKEIRQIRPPPHNSINKNQNKWSRFLDRTIQRKTRVASQVSPVLFSNKSQLLLLSSDFQSRDFLTGAAED